MTSDRPRIPDRGLRLFALVVISAASLVAVFSPIGCDDHWWHMLTGRWVLDHGAVPSVDPFSFTHHDLPWVNWEWLGGVLMAVAFDAFGGAGLVALRFVALLSTLLVIAAHLSSTQVPTPSASSREAAASPDPARLPTALALVGLCLVVVFGRVSDRPHLLALPLVAGAHLLATLAARRTSDSVRVRAVVAQLGLMVVWVALHPSWILGVAVHTAVMADAFISDPDSRRPAGGRLAHALYLAAPLLLCVPALVMHDVRDYATAVARLFGARSLTEWQPLWHYLHWSNVPLLASVIVSLAWLAALALSPRRLRLPSTWLVALLLIGSWWSVRFTAELAVLAVPSIYEVALARRGSRVASARTARLATVLLGALLVLVLLETKSVFRLPFSSEVDERANPVRVAAFMQQHHWGGNVLTTELNAQAYLAFMRYPDVHDYIDGRVPQVFPEAFLLQYRRAMDERARFEELLDHSPVDHVVVSEVFESRSVALTAALASRGDFALVHIDDHALMWTRRQTLDSLPSPPPPYRIVIPPLIDDGWFQRALSAAAFPDVVRELTRLLAEQPDSRIGATLLDTLRRQPGASENQRSLLEAIRSGR